MRENQRIAKSILELALVLFCTACILVFTTGCGRTVAPGGVYQGDQALYEADNVISTSHDLLQTFVTWEANNRQALATFPEIRKFADRIVDEGPSWFSSAMALRDAYKADPTAENRDKLQVAIDLIRAMVRQASSHLSRPVN